MNKKASKRSRLARQVVSVVLCLLLPALSGGCPEFRDDLIRAAEEATRSLIFDTQSPEQVIETAGVDILDSTIDLIFDVVRGSGTTG